MLYAALGDSITYGYDATTDEKSYVSRIVRELPRRTRVSLYVHAKPGWTSRHLRKTLSKVPDCIWKEARLVTIMVGGNDLLRAAPWLLNGSYKNVYTVAQRVQDNLEHIVQTVRPSHGTCIIATLYNPFPNSLLAEEYTDTVNQSILRIARRYKLALADVRKEFRNREHKYIEGYKQGTIKDMRLFGNPIHPNDAGHAAIAKVILAAYRKSGTRRTRPRRRR